MPSQPQSANLHSRMRQTCCEAPVGAAMEDVQGEGGWPGQQPLQAFGQLISTCVGHGLAPVSDPACTARCRIRCSTSLLAQHARGGWLVSTGTPMQRANGGTLVSDLVSRQLSHSICVAARFFTHTAGNAAQTSTIMAGTSLELAAEGRAASRQVQAALHSEGSHRVIRGAKVNNPAAELVENGVIWRMQPCWRAVCAACGAHAAPCACYARSARHKEVSERGTCMRLCIW